jgi:dipeptide/tripeptide permease
VLKIVLVFSMVSVFWALFDQHASTWIKQAGQMDLTFTMPYWLWTWFLVPAVVIMAAYGGTWLMLYVSNRPVPRALTRAVLGLCVLWAGVMAVIQLVAPRSQELVLDAAQISSLNPLMVMIIIPLLNGAVYAPLERRGITIKPLQKMTVGMFLASLAFVAVAVLQNQIEGLNASGEKISVAWQIVPYLIMTTAEVLVSTTGLEFAYTQAPRSMKSTIMGFWLLCVTVGNKLVAVMAPLQQMSLSTFFWTFAALMAAAAMVFATLAYFYKGKTYLQEAQS